MKTFQLSDDCWVTAKKNLVAIKQKNSDKSFEFTPTRYLLCSITLPSTILMSPAYITMFSLFASCCCAVTGGPLSDRCSRKSMPQSASYVAMNQSSSKRISAADSTSPSPVVTNASARSTFRSTKWTSDRPRRASLYVSTNGPI